jgi:hypothetical protein
MDTGTTLFQEETVIDCKKFLLHSLTPMLACCLLAGMGVASAPANAQNTSASQSDSTMHSTTSKAKTTRAERKAAKKAAKEREKAAKAQEKSNAEAKGSHSRQMETRNASSHANSSNMSASHNSRGSNMSASHQVAPMSGAGNNSRSIANAKARGMVWVNTGSKVYHTGGRYYGNTKHGQFMTRAEAESKGYRAAKR